VQARWTADAAAVGLEIDTGGLPALANFTIVGRDPLVMKTYITARMLSLGYLAGPNLYASIAHTPEILAEYHDTLATVFTEIATRSDDEIRASLPGGLAHTGFRRLT
jgi:glutamate-1-semialdehyde 2,1-aminomutase